MLKKAAPKAPPFLLSGGAGRPIADNRARCETHIESGQDARFGMHSSKRSKTVRRLVSQPFFVPAVSGLLVLGVLTEGSANRNAPGVEPTAASSNPRTKRLSTISRNTGPNVAMMCAGFSWRSAHPAPPA
jgi:hypothetical protein